MELARWKYRVPTRKRHQAQLKKQPVRRSDHVPKRWRIQQTLRAQTTDLLRQSPRPLELKAGGQ
jgi:hypothetical protein